jgi:hypothetical protein
MEVDWSYTITTHDHMYELCAPGLAVRILSLIAMLQSSAYT